MSTPDEWDSFTLWCNLCGQYHKQTSSAMTCPLKHSTTITTGDTSGSEENSLVDHIDEAIESLQALRAELQRKGGV